MAGCLHLMIVLCLVLLWRWDDCVICVVGINAIITNNRLIRMEKEVNCSNCCEEYTDNNPPRLLTHCGHTFCQRCLVKLAHTHQGTTTLTCPDDQMVLELKAGVLTLPKNIALLRYIEARQKNLPLKEDSSLEVSKVTKNEDLQEDEDANQLLTAITPSSPPLCSPPLCSPPPPPLEETPRE